MHIMLIAGRWRTHWVKVCDLIKEKLIREGRTQYKVVGVEKDGPGQNLNVFVADEDMNIFDFEDEGFD